MQEIPNWIIKVIEKESLKCRGCKEELNIDNLISISIQESSKPPHKDYLCIGLYCIKCKKLIIFEIKEMSLIDFAFEILDQETSDKIKKKSKDDVSAFMKSTDTYFDPPPANKTRRKKTNKKSNITLKEIEKARNFLKPKDLLHEDFLLALGFLPEEIEKYNYRK